MDYLQYLGRDEKEIIGYCTEKGLPYRVIETKDPRAASDNLTERRVIRIIQRPEALEILVGYFALPAYEPSS